jgi:acyl dehydratase
MKVKIALTALPTWLGLEVAVSDWVTITQERINLFAEATGDHQWIHVDAERAAAESPFRRPEGGDIGSTVAHGFLTLSMVPFLKESCIEFTGIKMGVNYGTNRVRFMAPVNVNSRLRGRFKLAGLEEIKGGVQMVWECTLEIEGQAKPACVAELVSRAYG